MNKRPPYVGSVLRDVVAVSVGFGLGVSWPLLGACAPNFTEPAAEEQRSAISSIVSAATWTDGPWPFTVDDGELRCLGPEDGPGVFFATDTGKLFALNPAAILMADRVGASADLGPIWREHPDMLGVMANVSPMILYGLTLC